MLRCNIAQSPLQMGFGFKRWRVAINEEFRKLFWQELGDERGKDWSVFSSEESPRH
jgi:hypothetical protein